MALAGLGGGMIAGLVTNPLDVVFTRMQVDEMYPAQARRNYKHVLDGLYKVSEEGALYRGLLANSLRIGVLAGTMTGIHDLVKENTYYWLGPSSINRFLGTASAVTVGTLVSMPFDMIRVRLQTMRPLPNGVFPYESTWDCLGKVKIVINNNLDS